MTSIVFEIRNATTGTVYDRIDLSRAHSSVVVHALDTMESELREVSPTHGAAITIRCRAP